MKLNPNIMTAHSCTGRNDRSYSCADVSTADVQIRSISRVIKVEVLPANHPSPAVCSGVFSEQSRTPARKVRCQISPKLKVCLFPSLLQSADTPRGAARMDSELRTTDKDRYLMRTSVPFSPCL